MPYQGIGGLPGPQTIRAQAYRSVRKSNQGMMYLEGGKVIKGSKSRDPGNTGYITTIRPGMLMGKITSGGLYAPATMGVTGAAIAATDVSVTLAAGTVTELLRRVGATGTFKITGPPTAAGVVQTLTATYSAASGTTATITALGVNEQQRVDMDVASTGGSVKITATHPTTGARTTTASAAWSATDATYLANINTQLDAAFGAGIIVATAIAATDTDLGFVLTYTARPFGGAANHDFASIALFPTSSTKANVSRATVSVDGRFVTGSLVQPTDGSETPRCLIDDGDGIKVVDIDGNSTDQPFPNALVGGSIVSANIIDWPADASTRIWVKQQLNSDSNEGFLFDDLY